MPVPNTEEIRKEISFNGLTAPIKNHISLLVFDLLRNDVRLNSLFEYLELNGTMKSESRFEIVRKIDLLFIALYKLTEPEVELMLTEFDKQYSEEDLDWFKNQLRTLLSDYTVSSSVSTATFSPIG